MATDYVLVKIDVDRMTHGKDVQKKYRKTDKGGIPWFWFMTPAGEIVATSDTEKGNIGHPYRPDEVAHFMTMIEKSSKRMTADQKAALSAALLGQEAADKAAAEAKKKAAAEKSKI